MRRWPRPRPWATRWWPSCAAPASPTRPNGDWCGSGSGRPVDVRTAATDLLAAARPEDGDVDVLVARQLAGARELIAGLVRDDVFGMTVMVGIGGVLAEAVADVTFRLVPISSGSTPRT